MVGRSGVSCPVRSRRIAGLLLRLRAALLRLGLRDILLLLVPVRRVRPVVPVPACLLWTPALGRRMGLQGRARLRNATGNRRSDAGVAQAGTRRAAVRLSEPAATA